MATGQGGAAAGPGPRKFQVPQPHPYWPNEGERPHLRWALWERQLTQFFTLTDLNSATKLTDFEKNLILSSLLGNEGFRQFSVHRVAGREENTTHQNYLAAVRELFARAPNPVRSHYEFSSRMQHPNEQIQDYLLALKTLQADANFHGHEEYHLAIQLACGCSNKEGQQKLLAQREVNLEEFVRILEAQESSTKDTSRIRGETRVAAARKPPPRTKYNPRDRIGGQQRATHQPKQGECSSCGQSGHKRGDSNCPAKGAKCFNCEKTNHFAKCCFGKKSTPDKKQAKSVRLIAQDNTSGGQKKAKIAVVAQQPSPSFKSTIGLEAESSGFVSLTAEVDSCSDLTGVPNSLFKKHFQSCKLESLLCSVTNFDGSPIKGIRGSFKAKATFNGRSAPLQVHVLPDSCEPVIGKDAIGALNMVLDGGSGQIHSVTQKQDNLEKQGEGTQPVSLSRAIPNPEFGNNQSGGDPPPPESKATNFLQGLDPFYKEMVGKYPGLLKDEIGLIPNYKHKIQLNADAKPVACKLRPIPLYRMEGACKEIRLMEEQGIWSRVDRAHWISGLVTVDKPDGSVRITTDLRNLNKHVFPYQYPLPNINELFLKLRHARVYTKLDLKKYFFNIELDEESKLLTTTATPLGPMAYNRLPLGLIDSGAVSQDVVQQVLAECTGTESYLDDIVVWGTTKEQHDRNLEQVLRTLEANNLRLQTSKCIFGASEILLLGHIISHGSLKPNPAKLEAIKDMVEPKNVTEVQVFLGLINWYSEYVPDFSALAEPLRQLTRKGAKFEMTSERKLAFETLKKVLCDKLELAIFDPEVPTILTTDASDVGIGGVLSQIQSGREVPIAFGHHALSARERGFAANEREGLAAMFFCEYFAKFLLGRHFKLRTDHQALTTLLSQYGSGRKKGKFARWQERLAEFNYTMEYCPGRENKVADALSRLRSKAMEHGVEAEATPELSIKSAMIKALEVDCLSWKLIKEESSNDAVLQEVLKALEGHWPSKSKITPELQPYYQARNDLESEDGCVIRDDFRIAVPASLRKSVLLLAHVGHPGIVRMKRKLRECYWWPGMDKQVEEFVRTCLPCQDSAKSHPKLHIEPESIPAPTKPMVKWAMDIAGPFHDAPPNQRFLVLATYVLCESAALSSCLHQTRKSRAEDQTFNAGTGSFWFSWRSCRNQTLKWFGLDCQPFMCHSVKGELDKKITATLKRASFVFLDYSQTSSESEKRNLDETAGNLIKVGATLASTVKYKEGDLLYSRVSFKKESGGLFQYIMRTESDVRCRLSSASSCILDRTGDDPGSPSVTPRHTDEGERKRTGSVSSPIPPKRGKKLAIVPPQEQETHTLPPSSILLGNEFPDQFMADEGEETDEARDQRETASEEANTKGGLDGEETETNDETGEEENQQHEDQPEGELGDDGEPSITDHAEYGNANVCDLHSNCHVSIVTSDNIRFTLCRVQLSHHSQKLRHQLERQGAQEGGDSHIALKMPSKVFSAWLHLADISRRADQDAEPHGCPLDGENFLLLVQFSMVLESSLYLFARLSEWLAQLECDWETKLQLVHLVADSPVESHAIINALIDCLAKETDHHLNELMSVCPPLSQMAQQRRIEMREARHTLNTNVDVDDKLFALYV